MGLLEKSVEKWSEEMSREAEVRRCEGAEVRRCGGAKVRRSEAVKVRRFAEERNPENPEAQHQQPKKGTRMSLAEYAPHALAQQQHTIL
jgi:hypothetical protein